MGLQLRRNLHYGGTNAPYSLTVSKGTVITLTGMTATAPEGKTFTGWATEAEGGNTITKVIMNDNEMIYAQYVDLPAEGYYVVHFSAGFNGAFSVADDPLAEQNVVPGDAVRSAPEIIPEEGYIFVGWKRNNAEYILAGEAISNVPVLGDAPSYTAVYAPATATFYTLSFDPGIGNTGTAGDVVLPEGTDTDVSLLIPEPPEGYAFIGWKDENGTIVDTITIGEDKTFTAQYAAVNPAGPFTVTFHGGTNGEMTPTVYSESVIGGGKVTGVPSISANNTYTFLGWSMNGGSSYYSSTDILKMSITGITNFVAQYQKTSIPGGGGGGGGTTTVTPQPAEDKASDVNENDGAGDASVINAGISEKIKEMLETENHIQYIRGHEDGTVRADSAITRAEVAMIFWRLLKNTEKNDAISSSFPDVSDKTWYAQAVNYLAEIGILQGYEDGAFRPDQGITRTEFATIATRFDYLKKGVALPFTDVPENSWGYDYIASAYMGGWISGYPGGVFLPNNEITRAEVVTIVNKMLGRRLKAEDVPVELRTLYPDLSTSHWAFADMIEASVAHEYSISYDGYGTWAQYDLR